MSIDPIREQKVTADTPKSRDPEEKEMKMVLNLARMKKVW